MNRPDGIIARRDEPSILTATIAEPVEMVAWTPEQVQELDEAAQMAGRRLVRLWGESGRPIVS